VSEDGEPGNDPGGAGSLAFVADRLHQQVIDAAEDCPGECIFIEMP
jgi:ferredoxin